MAEDVNNPLIASFFVKLYSSTTVIIPAGIIPLDPAVGAAQILPIEALCWEVENAFIIALFKASPHSVLPPSIRFFNFIDSPPITLPKVFMFFLTDDSEAFFITL